MAGNHDGKVTISTALDNSDIEKDIQEVSGEFGGLKKVLNNFSKSISGAMSKPVGEACAKIKKDIDAAQKKVERYQNQIQKAESAKMPLVEQAEQLGAELDAAKAKLVDLQAQQQAAGEILAGDGNAEAYIDAYAQKPQLDADVAQQQAKVDALQKQWDTVNDKVDSYNSKIDQANKKMVGQKVTVAELGKKLDSAEKETKQIRQNASGGKKEFGAMGKAVDSFTSRLKSIALGALLFNGISAGLREFTSYLGETLKTNEAFTTELSRLKGALLTAFQPIYNAVAPAVTYLMRLLTGATLAVAEFFASITGTTVEASAEAAKGLYEEVNALESMEKAAKMAGKTLAGFDELNVLQNENESLSTSGSTDIVAPDFAISDWGTGDLDTIKEAFKDIAGYIAVAAAGIAGFKLGSFIADLLTSEKKAKSLKNTLSQLGKKAGLVIGITLAITGIALETKGIVDAIQEGLSENSLLDILGGGAMITTGGAMIGKFFGKGVLGGAVGAIVAGIPAYITGIYDACMNGLNWLNGTLVVAGSTVAGAGIGAIIGSLGGPIGTGIGALIGLAAGLITDGILALATDQVEPALDVLTEAEHKLIEEVNLSADAFRNQQTATQEAMGGITAQMDYVQFLADELQGLADASGKVKEADEGRVNYILGELKKATGEEYLLVDGVIQRYDTLKDSIKNVVAQKTANLLLEAVNADYIQAIQEEVQAWEGVELAQKQYDAQLAVTKQKEDEYEAFKNDFNERLESGYYQYREAEELADRMRLQELQEIWEEEQGHLDTRDQELSLATDNYQVYSDRIISYEQAQEAAAAGNYEAVREILAGKGNAYSEHSAEVETETNHVLAILKKEAIDAGRKADLAKKNFENGVSGYTEEMVKEAEEGYQAALDAYANAYADSQGVGADMGDGLSDGMESKRSNLIEKAKSLVNSILESFRKTADSHSPSKKTIALGEDIGVGPGIGIENETDSAVKAAENQVEAVIDAYESQSAVDSGKNIGSTFADGIYSSVKSISAAGAKAAKAAMSALSVDGGGHISSSWRISTPKIPQLARGAVLPANKPFLAMVGDQKHGTNIEAPLSTIQEAVALVMQDQTQAILAGFEASVGVQREILEAVLGIQIGDDVIGNAVARYSRKQAVIRGGAL